MASSLDWSQCPVVESIPGKVSGAWVFRGTRVPVTAIFENLKTSPLEEVLENFHVTREQVQTVLDFAAKSAQPPQQNLAGRAISLVVLSTNNWSFIKANVAGIMAAINAATPG